MDGEFLIRGTWPYPDRWWRRLPDDTIHVLDFGGKPGGPLEEDLRVIAPDDPDYASGAAIVDRAPNEAARLIGELMAAGKSRAEAESSIGWPPNDPYAGQMPTDEIMRIYKESLPAPGSFSMDDEPEPEGFAEFSAVESAKAAMRRGISEASAREAFGVPDDVPLR